MGSAIRCAVIGLGMGRHHLTGYLEHSDAKVVGIADADSKRLGEFAEKAGGKQNCFSDYKKMLKETKPDIVSIVLPNCMHKPVTLDCFKAGAHVLCEKPMAMNVREAEAMLAASEKAKRKLGINLSYRFAGPSRALKNMADGGFLGTPYHAYTSWMRRDGFPGFGSWFGQKKMSGGGPLIDLGVHRLDMAMWLLGSPQPVSVSGAAHFKIGLPRAKATGKAFDVEDLAAGFVRFKNGVSLVFEISWAGHQQDNEQMATVVMGTKGTLVQRNDDGGYHFVADFHSELHGEKVSGSVMSPRNVKTAYWEMVEAVKNNKPLLADGHDGIRIQKVLDGLYQSAALGREVRV